MTDARRITVGPIAAAYLEIQQGVVLVPATDYDALHAEAEALRVALAGMLFAFDDGVGQEWSKPLLDYARTLTPAQEYKP